MQRAGAVRMLWTKKGGTVQEWMSIFDWTSMGMAALAWIALIAFIGYTACLVAWRTPRPRT
jgi:hypothetical protein